MIFSLKNSVHNIKNIVLFIKVFRWLFEQHKALQDEGDLIRLSVIKWFLRCVNEADGFDEKISANDLMILIFRSSGRRAWCVELPEWQRVHYA
ncbi:hypothetical protein A8L45_16115 [Veronia pacifica]|uniref:Uncharacterized protein n=1 Tax=Veronia pacifica TaxID=1080227 RepID=A0A1C3EEI8_9GAMM|nr:hypothetical protein A8L45_16115 [Veronia pacifica]